MKMQGRNIINETDCVTTQSNHCLPYCQNIEIGNQEIETLGMKLVQALRLKVGSLATNASLVIHAPYLPHLLSSEVRFPLEPFLFHLLNPEEV